MNKLLDFIIGREHNYNCQKGVTYALCTRDALSKKAGHLTNAPSTKNTNRADTMKNRYNLMTAILAPLAAAFNFCCAAGKQKPGAAVLAGT